MMRISLESPALIAVRTWLAGSQPTRRAGRSPAAFRPEQLEPRLALATGLLSTLVSVVRDDNSHSLLAPGATAEVAEGTELAASVRLTRKPDSAITVTFTSLAPLEVGAKDWYFPTAAAPSTTLRFTRANWNQPQAVSFASLQDGSRDGDHLVPVRMTAAIARQPEAKASKRIWIESLDSSVVTPATPVTDSVKGSIVGGSYGGIQGTYDSVLNRGTVTLKVTMPQLDKVRDRVITVGYSLGPDNRAHIESLQGITASRFRWDATYRNFGADRGLFGTFTVLQPKLGRSATAMLTAAAVPVPVQNLAVAATGVGSLLLSWNPPEGGATSYTVSMNNGSTTTTYPATTATSMPFTGLSPTVPSYTFTVTPAAAGGAGPAATAGYSAAAMVTLGENTGSCSPTTGLDGSIWVANSLSGSVQQITNSNGSWIAQPPITVGTGSSNPVNLTTALDGSIWVALSRNNAIQQIRLVDGVWKAQPPIAVGSYPYAITAGLDGSVWVSCVHSLTPAVQQVVSTNGDWAARPPIMIDRLATAMTTSLDGSIWVTAIGGTGSGPNVVPVVPFLFSLPSTLATSAPSSRDSSAYFPGTTIQQIARLDGTWTAQSPIKVGNNPIAVAPHSDGSIWVANYSSNTVQQVTNSNGTWAAQSGIPVGEHPAWLCAGPAGSAWVVNEKSNSLQQIVKSGGAWTTMPAISLAGASNTATGLTRGLDGSAWISSFTKLPGYIKAGGLWNSTSFLQQSYTAPLAPENLSAIVGPGPGELTLGWTAPPAGGSPIISYTATVFRGTSTQTITTTSTSCTFSGLAPGPETTYVIVTASNFVGTSPATPLLIGADGNPVDIGNKVVGIATDGTPFSGGGFDGDGNAYSWQALGSSAALAWNGVTFDLGGPNQPECTPAVGQTINVPQGSFTMLNLAGAAVNGSQQNQQLTLTFTDASTVTWTQSFSDWGSPQNYGHEAIVSTQSYRDTASGGSQQFTNHVYGYSYTIPAGKTLASITLPNNKNVRFLDLQMSTSTSVDLSSSYTSWGIANGSTQVANHQGFDGGGYYYYSGNLQSTIAWSGATFTFGPVPGSNKGANNFVQGKGQTINVPQGDFGWVYLAGAAANGSQTSQPLTLSFSDGSTATWTQSFSDWCSPSGFSGESIIQMQPNWVNQVGNVHSQTNYVYGYAYRIPAGKALASIALPKNTNVGILGIAML